MYRYKLYRYEHRFYRKSHGKVARVEDILQLRFAEGKNLIPMSAKFHVDYTRILPREESWKCLWSDWPREAQNMVLGLFSKSYANEYVYILLKSKNINTHFQGLLKKYDMGCTIPLQTKNFFEGIDLELY